MNRGGRRSRKAARASAASRALDRENKAQVLAVMTQDAAEARAAFLERRPPRFIDR